MKLNKISIFIGVFLFNALYVPLSAISQINNFLIVFRAKANLDSIQNSFQSNKTPVNQRPIEVLKQLQIVSSQSSKKWTPQLMALKAEGKIIDYEFYWIVNALKVTVENNLPQKLVSGSDISYVINLNEFVFQPIMPVEMKEEIGTQRAIGGVEPGLMAVNVRGVWDLGYTGLGRKLLSFDTGVWPDHPALGGRFLGNYFPLNQCWKGFFSSIPVDKSNSHGTHTIGTAAGLDPATADTIGLAFKAYFMATDPIVQNPADVLPWDVLMSGFQWALNPDGDVNTSADVPDVICNSWGRFLNDTSLCESIVSETLIALELSGIAVEFSAGNNGPGDTTIGAPSFINPTHLNNFSVGAVNGNVASWPIANFSSRGPSICTSTGARQIKPEVVAPGVDVRSCVGQNNYALYSGTSMAGPHVAGAMLLLKEAFPFLTGTELKEALYETAIDLGVPGEDNVYGRGMIDITAAFNYLAQNHTPVPPNNSPYDIELTEILSHQSKFTCVHNIQPVIKIKNIGNQPVTGLKCIQKLTGNSMEMSDIFSNLTLNPQQDTVLNLSVYTTNFDGNNELQIVVKPLQNIIEFDSVNNYRIARYFYNPLRALQYDEGFESGNLYDAKCYIINPDNARTWDTVSTQGLGINNHSACLKFTGYGPPTFQKDDLILPRVSIPTGATKLTLSFDVAYQFKASTKKDSLLILVSKDCGVTYPFTIYKGWGDSLATVTGTTPSIFTPTQNSDWKNVKVALNQFLSDSEILLNFRAVNQSGGNLYIDNIKIYIGDQPISIENTNLASFKIFPNPNQGTFTVQADELLSMDSNFKLIDLLGKVVFESRLLKGSNIYSIKCGDVIPGIYTCLIQNHKTAFAEKIVIY
jgi:bacillopeptidase F